MEFALCSRRMGGTGRKRRGRGLAPFPTWAKLVTFRAGPTMITRRAVFQGVAAHALGGCLGGAQAWAQSKRKHTGKKVATIDAIVVPSDPRVEAALAPVRDKHQLPGLIGGVLKGDRLAAIGAVGARKLGAPQPIRVTDQVHLGSCTKAMTATLIGMLVDDGKLSWGSTIRAVFPDVAAKLSSEYQKVTVSQLLTHRAGLPANAPWERFQGRTTTLQRRSLLTTLLVNPPQNPPGSTYVYSNVGYVLLGLIAERASGQSWETLMRRRLFEPLGMATAGFGAPGRPGTVDQPWGHQFRTSLVEPTQQDNPPMLGPAGTVHCSVPDWAKFIAVHLAGARGQAKLLKLATFQALHSPPAGSEYVGGWMVVDREWAGGRALTFSGGNSAWFATAWLAPARDFAILVSTNQGDKVAELAIDQAVMAMLQAFNEPG